MNIFGIGPTEILLIVVLALIVFGPQRLPEIMAQVGKTINDFRRISAQLSDEFNRTMQTEFGDTRALMDETRSTVLNAQTAVTSVMSGSVTPPPQLAATAPAPLPTVNGSGATNGVNGTNGTNGATPNGTSAESSPALASTSQWRWETTAAGTST